MFSRIEFHWFSFVSVFFVGIYVYMFVRVGINMCVQLHGYQSLISDVLLNCSPQYFPETVSLLVLNMLNSSAACPATPSNPPICRLSTGLRGAVCVELEASLLVLWMWSRILMLPHKHFTDSPKKTFHTEVYHFFF